MPVAEIAEENTTGIISVLGVPLLGRLCVSDATQTTVPIDYQHGYFDGAGDGERRGTKSERKRCLEIISQYGGADFREIEEAIRAGDLP